MLDIKRIRTDFDAVAEKLATRGVTQFLLRLPKLSATRKMQMTRLLPCKLYLLRLKPWMLNWQTSMLN